MGPAAVRGVIGGVLTLIVLQAIGSSRGPEQTGKLLLWLNSGLTRALSPKVAAIPTRKPPAATKPGGAASKPGQIGLPNNPPLTTVTI